jgi:glycerophosphoryl diester phosphodiesterase
MKQATATGPPSLKKEITWTISFMKRTNGFLSLLIFMIACSPGKNTTVIPDAKPLDLQGHRGCRGLMPENTIPAMIRAIDLRVFTLELDVVISADKKVVVSHDVYFHENITTTPEGNFLTKAEAAKRLLFTMPYDSVRRYDVGLKPHPDFPRQQKMAVNKPLLSELFDSTQAHARRLGRHIQYNIEVKSMPENDGKKHPPVDEFAQLVMAVIQSKGLEEAVTIQSFDSRALRAIRAGYPSMRTSLLINAPDLRSLDQQLDELGFVPEVYSPHFSRVSKNLVMKCREKNMLLVPWTVNELQKMKELKEMGVNGIISDYPDLFEQL